MASGGNGRMIGFEQLRQYEMIRFGIGEFFEYLDYWLRCWWRIELYVYQHWGGYAIIGAQKGQKISKLTQKGRG